MKQLCCALAAIVGASLAACTSGQLPPDLAMAPVHEERRLAVGYIERYLLSPIEQRLLLEELGRESTGGPYAGPTGIAGPVAALAAGKAPLSPEGAAIAGQVSLAAGALDALTAGSPSVVSAFYVPKVVDDHLVTSADDARRLAREHMVSGLQEWAQAEGRAVACVFGCSGNAPTFRISGAGDGDVQLHVSFYVHPMTAVRPDTVRDGILGFTPAWQSPSINGLGLCVTAQALPNDDMAPVGVHGGLGSYLRHPCTSRFKSRLERTLLRTLTRRGFYTVAFRTAGIAAIQGQLYEIASTRAKSFIGGRIEERSDQKLSAPARLGERSTTQPLSSEKG